MNRDSAAFEHTADTAKRVSSSAPNGAVKTRKCGTTACTVAEDTCRYANRENGRHAVPKQQFACEAASYLCGLRGARRRARLPWRHSIPSFLIRYRSARKLMPSSLAAAVLL